MIQEELHDYVKQAASSITNPQLSPLGRFKLATETVNVTLKGLTEALKTLQNADSSRHRCARRSSSATSSGFDPRTRALAECARMAFAELRKLKLTTDMPYLQLETGMSALINKLIALGMDDLAFKELRILTRRLSISIATPDNRSRPQKRGKLQQLEAMPSKQTLTDLLRVEKIPTDPQVLSLIIASQLQIMKVIALKKRVSDIEVAIQHLQRSKSYSPINLLESLVANPLPELRKKTVKQLEVLAPVLLSLCPSSAQADDELETGPRRFPMPHIVLQYQLLVIDVRSILWRLSESQLDLKELLDPLARYLRTFNRRSVLKASDTYMTAKSTLDSFFTLVVGNSSDGSAKGIKQWDGFAEIYRFLAESAQKSQHFADATRFMKDFISILDRSGASQARRCGALCHYASMSLQAQATADNVDVSQTLTELQAAINALRGSLQGESMDMDELLTRTGELRKSATSALLAGTKQLEGSLEYPCIELVLLTSGFLSRYIGQAHRLTEGTKCMSRFEKRLDLATPHVRPTIEAVVSLSRLPTTHGPEWWKRIDSALQDCATLLTNLEAHAGLITSSSCERRSPYVLISNAYWSHWVRQDKVRSESAEIQSCLQKSVDFISRRPAVDQNVGMLSVKLEKLAGVYEASNDMRNARRVITEALRAQIVSGSLRTAAEAAATKPWTRVLEDDAGAKAVARLIAGYLRVSIKQKSEKPGIHFDDEQLAPDQRGLLLEHQLAILTTTTNRQAPSANIKLALQMISSTLLEVYTEEQYPVRRLRICVQLLALHSAKPTLVGAKVLRQIETARLSSEQPPGADVGLIRFIPYLLARQEVYCAIAQSVHHSSDLQCSLDGWLGLVRDCRDWAALRDQVDDASEWLNQLYAMAEYLHMKGFDFQRVLLLRLVISIFELQSSAPPASYISHLISYGLQLARVGYSGRAGAVFQKARKLLDDSGIEPHISFEWHSAYAEYLLQIGNVDKR